MKTVLKVEKLKTGRPGDGVGGGVEDVSLREAEV